MSQLRRRIWWFLLIFAAVCAGARAQTLLLPPRAADAPGGIEFARTIESLDRSHREEKIYQQVAAGNVPRFLRKLVPVTVSSVAEGQTNLATYFAAPDYLAVGSDEDYFLTPLTPIAAQRVADLLHCSLPTRKMVDDIYAAATLKLVPSPIPPSVSMTSVTIFVEHDLTVRTQRSEQLLKHPLGELVAGHKKDVVISAKLAGAPGKVAIYGWHKPDGKAIQPLYTGHVETWADYSHGIRLVQLAMTVNGKPSTVPEVLASAELSPLLSDEGAVTQPRYPVDFRKPGTNSPAAVSARLAPPKIVTLQEFTNAPFNERVIAYTIDPSVFVRINAPDNLSTNKPLSLVLFTLPNGNTTDQTIGRKLRTGDDWHYDIQHIGAQTRWLRDRFPNRQFAVAYLEADSKSWPSWRKVHADIPRRIQEVVSAIQSVFKDFQVRTTLSGHSGGGSFIFGYINGVSKIPGDIERIAFLDSNYAYDKSEGHRDKLETWLRASDQHYLTILAYNDAVALLNGKTFVSAEGGTWGRTHAMLRDFADMGFTSRTNDLLETWIALDGRAEFLMMNNPEKKIFHTVQVERNGFIQCLLAGTPEEGKGYKYFGARAYTNWISE